jgi:hypothetical protein
VYNGRFPSHKKSRGIPRGTNVGASDGFAATGDRGGIEGEALSELMSDGCLDRPPVTLSPLTEQADNLDQFLNLSRSN